MRLNIPKQSGGFDCGIYLLEYAERFMLSPSDFLSSPDTVYYSNIDKLEKITIKIVKYLDEEDVENAKLLMEKYSYLGDKIKRLIRVQNKS
jgi:hypothetical protein